MASGMGGTIDRERFPLTGDFLAGRLRQIFDEDDLLYVEQLVSQMHHVDDGACLIERGDLTHHSTILIEGFVFRTIESEGRRFIVGVHVPGDFIDLHGFALKRLDHNLVSAGPAMVGIVNHAQLTETLRERPTLARAMWFATLLDAAIHRKWIQTLEQLDAPQRIAHIFAELQTRLAVIGRHRSGALRTPFTQPDLADMCGVSAIHANRAVGKLRELDIATIRRGDFYAQDWDAVRRFAQFDPSYLYCEGPLCLKGGWD